MTVIKVENLGKKYIIDHQKRESRYRYETLGGALANCGKRAVNFLRHPVASFNNSIEHEEFWALKDINFEINQGDRVGIIGRNGAGKSTLLKILSRITAPTTGQVRIKGRVSSLLEVGTGFHPELTGRENIYLNGAILGMKRYEIKAKFDEIVAFAEVEKFLDTPVKHYSSGMYVRLAFAVAANLEPDILIVDEVLAVGDLDFQKKCLGRLGKVSDDGRTVLFVSHNMSAIQSLCEKSILIEDGTLKEFNNSKETINKFLQSFYRIENINLKNIGTRFLDVFIENDVGIKCNFLNPNNKFYLVFHIYIEENKDINLGFTIFKNNSPIISSFCKDYISDIPNGNSQIKMEIPVSMLTSGNYIVEGALWNSYKIYDQNDNLTSFHFQRNSVLESQGLNYRGMLAYKPDNWEITNIE